MRPTQIVVSLIKELGLFAIFLIMILRSWPKAIQTLELIETQYSFSFDQELIEKMVNTSVLSLKTSFMGYATVKTFKALAAALLRTGKLSELQPDLSKKQLKGIKRTINTPSSVPFRLNFWGKRETCYVFFLRLLLFLKMRHGF